MHEFADAEKCRIIDIILEACDAYARLQRFKPPPER